MWRTILSLFFVAVFCASFSTPVFGQEPQHRKHRHGKVRKVPGATGEDDSLNRVNAIKQDGTNDNLTRVGIVGLVDGQQGTFSVWLRIDGGDGVIFRIQSSTSDAVSLIRQADNTFQLRGENAAGTIILLVDSNSTYVTSVNWIHILASWDLSVPEAHLFINDIDDEAVGSTETNDTINYTVTNYSIGSTTGGAQRFNGCFSEIYINWSEFLNIRLETVRRDFISPSLKPVNLGNQGRLPTGNTPHIYLNNAAVNWQNNKGSGGNFVVVGAFDDCTTTPID